MDPLREPAVFPQLMSSQSLLFTEHTQTWNGYWSPRPQTISPTTDDRVDDDICLDYFQEEAITVIFCLRLGSIPGINVFIRQSDSINWLMEPHLQAGVRRDALPHRRVASARRGATGATGAAREGLPLEPEWTPWEERRVRPRCWTLEAKWDSGGNMKGGHTPGD